MPSKIFQIFRILDLRFYFQPDDDCTVTCKLLYTSIKNWQNTLVVPEIRSDDPIFKRLVTQVWEEYQYELNQEGELFGYVVDPFEVDSKLPNPINDSFSGPGYQANVQMHDIKVYLILYLLVRNSITHLTIAYTTGLKSVHYKCLQGFTSQLIGRLFGPGQKLKK